MKQNRSSIFNLLLYVHILILNVTPWNCFKIVLLPVELLWLSRRFVSTARRCWGYKICTPAIRWLRWTLHFLYPKGTWVLDFSSVLELLGTNRSSRTFSFVAGTFSCNQKKHVEDIHNSWMFHQEASVETIEMIKTCCYNCANNLFFINIELFTSLWKKQVSRNLNGLCCRRS